STSENCETPTSGSVDSCRARPPDKALPRGIQGIQLFHSSHRASRFSLGKLRVALSRNGKDKGLRDRVYQSRPKSSVEHTSRMPKNDAPPIGTNCASSVGQNLEETVREEEHSLGTLPENEVERNVQEIHPSPGGLQR